MSCFDLPFRVNKVPISYELQLKVYMFWGGVSVSRLKYHDAQGDVQLETKTVLLIYSLMTLDRVDRGPLTCITVL